MPTDEASPQLVSAPLNNIKYDRDKKYVKNLEMLSIFLHVSWASLRINTAFLQIVPQ